jgi:hypothetical protein
MSRRVENDGQKRWRAHADDWTRCSKRACVTALRLLLLVERDSLLGAAATPAFVRG